MKSKAVAFFKSLELCNAFRAMGRISVEPSQANSVRASVLEAIKTGKVKWRDDFSYVLSPEEHLFIREACRLFRRAQRTGDFSEKTKLNDELILVNAVEIKDFLSRVFSFDTAPVLDYVEKVISAGKHV